VTAPVWVALYMGPTTALLDRVEAWPVAGVWLDCLTDPEVLDKLAERSFGNGKSLGLGIMDARNTKLETVDQMRIRLGKVANKTPVERIVVTTSAGLEFLPRQRAQEKLARLSESVQAFLNQG
jgi:5-methyltetrahydropteroyltriglutamate--homocysteine methyltransferase